MYVNLITSYKGRLLIGGQRVLLSPTDDGRMSLTDISSYIGVKIAVVEQDRLTTIDVDPPAQEHRLYGISKEPIRFSKFSESNVAILRLPGLQALDQPNPIDVVACIREAESKAQINCRIVASKNAIFYGKLKNRKSATLMDWNTFKNETEDGKAPILRTVVTRCGFPIITTNTLLNELLILIDNGPDDAGHRYAIAEFAPAIGAFGIFELF